MRLHRMHRLHAAILSVLVTCIGLACLGCKSDRQRVVLYTSVDQPIAQPIIAEFEKRTGITVELQTDTEATKSSGLAARLQAEQANPQADVWWGNEVFHTINLAEGGAFEAYDAPAGRDVPDRFKDAQHRWTGQGLRARVLARNTTAHRGWDRSTSTGLAALLDPAVKGKVAIALPTAGTTGGHVAALYVLWGHDRAEKFFRDLHANDVKLLGGNSNVADAIGNGTIWLGLTDNDDADAARREGGQIEAVAPDQGADGQGTLLIPSTVALVAKSKHPKAAKKLIDYLLSAEVEQKLIEAKFAKYAVRGAGARDVKAMDVDYAAAAKALPQAVDEATAIMQGRR